MKNFNLILLLLITSLCYSQTKSPSDDLMNFEPGQLIVKFKDDYRANITYDSKGVGTTQLDLNAVLGIKAELKTSKVMFFEESVKLSVARKEAQDIRLKMSSANGATTNNGFKEPEITTLKNIFKLEFENKDENVFGLIEKIKSNPNVEYVEPNLRLQH